MRIAAVQLQDPYMVPMAAMRLREFYFVSGMRSMSFSIISRFA